MNDNSSSQSEEIRYREFIAAACIVATVLADRLWNATNAPATVRKPLAAEPQALNAQQAAKYIGLGRTKFLELAKAGEAPKPVRIGGRPRWLTKQLDRYLERAAKLAAKT